MDEEKNNREGEGGHKSTSPVHGSVNVSNALLAAVAVLVIMSGIQMFQMQSIVSAVANGKIKAQTQTQGSAVGLPSQVGGCG